MGELNSTEQIYEEELKKHTRSNPSSELSPTPPDSQSSSERFEDTPFPSKMVTIDDSLTTESQKGNIAQSQNKRTIVEYFSNPQNSQKGQGFILNKDIAKLDNSEGLLQEISDLNSFLENSFSLGNSNSIPDFMPKKEEKVDSNGDFPFQLLESFVDRPSKNQNIKELSEGESLISDRPIKRARLSDHFREILSADNNSIENTKVIESNQGLIITTPPKSPSDQVLDIISASKNEGKTNQQSNWDSPLTKSFREESMFLVDGSLRKGNQSSLSSPSINSTNGGLNQVESDLKSTPVKKRGSPQKSIILSSGKKGNNREDSQLKKNYELEVEDVLIRHVNEIGKDPVQGQSSDHKVHISKKITECLNQLDSLSSDISKLGEEKDRNVISELNRDFLGLTDSNENRLKALLFNKIKHALTLSYRISNFKTALSRMDSFIDKLADYRKKILSERRERESSESIDNLRSAMARSIGLRVSRVNFSEIEKKVIYNFCFKDSLVILAKTELRSFKVDYLQIYVTKVEKSVLQKTRNRNYTSDLILSKFKQKMSTNGEYPLFGTIQFVCNAFLIVSTLFSLLSEKHGERKIDDFQLNSDFTVEIKVIPTLLSFVQFNLFLSFNENLMLKVIYKTNVLEKGAQRVFEEQLKNVIEWIDESISLLNLKESDQISVFDNFLNELSEKTLFESAKKQKDSSIRISC